MIPAIGLLTYAWFGFNLMYPGTFNGFIGFAGFGLPFPTVAGGFLDLAYNEGYTYWTDFLFQGMFAATAATIVSGAVAERIKLSSFLVFSTIFVGLVYPIVGSWKSLYTPLSAHGNGEADGWTAWDSMTLRALPWYTP
jgi:Amt family ammonium transporter